MNQDNEKSYYDPTKKSNKRLTIQQNSIPKDEG